MPAHFIDVEGIDQSGKKTQTRLLAARLRRDGFKSSTISFPVYNTPSGSEIRGFLDGRRKYPPQAVHMLYSLNRWETQKKITRALKDTGFLVTDRYTASNLAYGVARGLDLQWLLNLDRGLPEPDTVVILDVPVGSSFARKTMRRDLHESDRALLMRVRRNYLKLSEKFHWHIVNGTGPAKTVHSEILKILGIK